MTTQLPFASSNPNRTSRACKVVVKYLLGMQHNPLDYKETKRFLAISFLMLNDKRYDGKGQIICMPDVSWLDPSGLSHIFRISDETLASPDSRHFR
ncbi:unnamed protein product [Allacma fusca]|uniref:Uncharacterized protein n=1 Tax=Allacma fusca TaxID=39272 RepID=A0A8J2JY26_9HEXA|nr:unnamed protein product [Allacma fusca]